MHLFLLPPDYGGEDRITLNGKEFHYLTNVLRLKEGDTLDGQDSHGQKYGLKLISVAKNSLVLSCMKDEEKRIKTLPDITLYQCICKGKKMDRIIRQATEIGAASVVPVISEYTIPKIDRKDSKTRIDRWKRIVREAVQQSASPVITEIKNPVMLSEIGEISAPDEINLFFHQTPLENRSLHEYLSGYPSRISLLIGPEGGLSEKETKLLQERGFSPVFLKTNILRAETAAVYGLSAVQTIVMEREFWRET